MKTASLGHLLPQPAHEVVRPAVDLLDRVAVLRGERGVVHRVPRVDEAPHHVRDAVGGLDRGHEEVPVVALQALEDDLLAVVQRPVGVVEELGLVEPPLVEGLVRRLRPPERAVEADLPGEVRRERVRLRDRDRGVARVQVHRGGVDPQLPVGLAHVELRHPVHAHEEVDLEGERDPLAPVAGLEAQPVALDLDLGAPLPFGPAHGHREVDVLAGGELVEPRLLLVGEAARLLLRLEGRLLLLEDRVLGALEHGLGDAGVEEEPLQEARRTRCCPPRTRRGRSPSSRTSRASRARPAGAGPRASRRGASPREGT